MPTQKLWGTTETIFLNAQLQIDHVRGLAGGASSMHLHRGKANTFIVVRGVLGVRFSDDVLWRVLAENESFTVRPGIKHRMTFLADCEAIEVYHAEPGTKIDPVDIVRFDEGWAPKPGEYHEMLAQLNQRTME